VIFFDLVENTTVWDVFFVGICQRISFVMGLHGLFNASQVYGDRCFVRCMGRCFDVVKNSTVLVEKLF